MKKLMIALGAATIGVFAFAQEGEVAQEALTSAPAAEVAAQAPAEITPSAPAEEVAAQAPAENAPSAPAPQKKNQPQQSSGGFGMFMPMIIILAIFYFMMIRPQQRKEKERRNMINELKAGAKVLFSGGIVGTIVEANEKTFIVETAPGTRMEILRAAVQGSAEAEPAAK